MSVLKSGGRLESSIDAHNKTATRPPGTAITCHTYQEHGPNAVTILCRKRVFLRGVGWLTVVYVDVWLRSFYRVQTLHFKKMGNCNVKYVRDQKNYSGDGNKEAQ